MKGFSVTANGTPGPRYRKVNEAIAEAAACSEVTALIERLGEPDTVDDGGDVRTPSQHMAELGSRFRFDDEEAEWVLTWIDPYRPRRHYRFAISAGRVTGHWLETVSG